MQTNAFFVLSRRQAQALADQLDALSKGRVSLLHQGDHTLLRFEASDQTFASPEYRLIITRLTCPTLRVHQLPAPLPERHCAWLVYRTTQGSIEARILVCPEIKVPLLEADESALPLPGVQHFLSNATPFQAEVWQSVQTAFPETALAQFPSNHRLSAVMRFYPDSLRAAQDAIGACEHVYRVTQEVMTETSDPWYWRGDVTLLEEGGVRSCRSGDIIVVMNRAYGRTAEGTWVDLETYQQGFDYNRFWKSDWLRPCPEVTFISPRPS